MSEQQDRRLKISGSVVYTIVLLVLLGFIIGSALAPTYQVVYYDNQLRHIPSLTMFRDGAQEEITLPATIYDVKKDERIVLTGNYQTKSHDSLLVKISGAKLVLFIDGNEAYSIKGEINTYPAFQKSPSPDIMFVALPNENGTKMLRFEYTVPEARDKLELSSIFLGENSILFGHLAADNSLPFVLGGILMISGVLIVSFTLMVMQRIKQISPILWLGAASFLAGLIGFCGNDLAVYLITMPNLLYSASLIGVTVFSVPFLQYARLMLDPVHKIPLRVIQIIINLIVLALIALHLLGVVPYVQDQMLVHGVLLLSVLAFAFYVIFEYVTYGNDQAKFHIVPASILLLCTVANTIDRFVYNFIRDDLLFQIGVLVFVLLTAVIGWNYMKRLFEEAERSTQLELEVNTMNRSLDMQRSLYQSLTRSTEEVRRVRHDLRHQLSAIRGYLQKGNVEGAIGYVETISGGIPDISNKLLADNFAVNAVAVYYLDKALRSNIKTDIKLVVPEDLGQVSDNDMSIIVGNLFENAIEACQHVEEDKRFINISCKVLKNRLTLTIDNSFDGNYSEKDGTLYSRKRDGKGVGVSSVKAVVERYGGSMKIEAAKGVFMVSLYVKM
jgi:signal transduction histidine kinase